MNADNRKSLYSTQRVLGNLVEKDRLYNDYRRAMEAAGQKVEPMKYVNENGRTVRADSSEESVMRRRAEYEALRQGNRGMETAGQLRTEVGPGGQAGTRERASAPARTKTSFAELAGMDGAPRQKTRTQTCTAPVRERELGK